MNEKIPPPKKMVSRSGAVLLGIICIVLVAGLAGAMIYYSNYVSNHSHNNADYDYLNSQYQAMWAPKLVGVNLVANDNHPWFSSAYLNVNGYVVNVNNNWAYNCELLVLAYGVSGVLAINETIPLGTMPGQGYYQVNQNLDYSSGSITSYTITPQWTATP